MKASTVLSLGIVVCLILIGNYYTGITSGFNSWIIRFSGIFAFFLLSLSLAIGPLAVVDFGRFCSLIKSRRYVGIASFLVLAVHFFFVMDNYFGWEFATVISNFDLFSGLIATVICVPLFLTSCDYAIKMLGMKTWKTLQYFTYLAFVFAFYHYLVKAAGPAQIFSWNLVEFVMVVFGVLVVLMQVFGFFIRIKRKGKNQECSS